MNVYIMLGTAASFTLAAATTAAVPGSEKSAPRVQTETVQIVHREHITNKPFKDVLAAFVAATGSVEEGFGRVADQAEDAAAFEKIFQSREGSSGFMRFDVIDHGKWLAQVGQPGKKAVMVVLGNPLIARTMLQHDIRAGLNVPVRIFIYEHDDGTTRVAYDLPSTLMSGLRNGDVAAAAAKLDARLVALAEAVTGVMPTDR